MKEENSKLVVTIIVLASLLLSVYLSAVVVAVVKDVSITTVIHNWQLAVVGAWLFKKPD